MALVPENSPAWTARRVTIEAAEPVTFWQMLDRVAAAGQLQHNIGMGFAANGRNGVQFLAGSGASSFPTSDSGPFRVTVHGVHLHRDLSFGPGPMATVPNARIAGAGLHALPQGGQAAIAVQFSVDLQIVAEPRMIVTQNGAIKLIEAVDDRGQSLVPAGASAGAVQRPAGYFGAYGTGMTMFTAQAQLQTPPQTGAKIDRLRGLIPVLVAARKEDPLTVTLAEAKGKTFQTGDLSVTIHAVQPDPGQNGASSIDLSIRPNNTSSDPMARLNRNPFETFTLRSPQMTQTQIEILDSQGRIYTQWITTSIQVNNEESRMSLRMMPNEQLGARAAPHLRPGAAQADATFDFRDIPIP